jgi:hypothetical protein
MSRAYWGFALLALAALALWLAEGDRRAHRAIVAAGVPVQAQVVARRLDWSGDWWLAYAFVAPDGTELRGQGAAERVVAMGGNADPYRRGAALEVLHLPADPGRNQPRSAPEPRRAMGWLGLATLAGIMGLSLLALAFGGGGEPARPPSGAERAAPALRLSMRAWLGAWLLWLGLALAAGAAGLWWLAQAPVRAERALWDAAVAGQVVERLGTVTGRSLGSRIVGTDRVTGQQRRAVLFHLDYALVTPDGLRRTGQSRVFGVEYDRLGPGAEVLVRVRPDAPDTHSLALAAPAPDIWWLRSLAITLGAAAALAALLYGGETAARARAARSGRARDATVTGHRPALFGHVSFARTDAAGETGLSPALPRRHLPPVGATVTLRVDPQRRFLWPEALL